jgi:hypothetical protein
MVESARRDYDIAIARRLMASDGAVPWLTFPKAFEDTGDMLAVANGSEAVLLNELRHYLSQRADEAAVMLA